MESVSRRKRTFCEKKLFQLRYVRPTSHSNSSTASYQWRTEGVVWGGSTPPSEIPKAPQNRAKLNLIWKLLKLLNLGRQHRKMFEKRQ